MKFEQIPKDLTWLELTTICDVDGCFDEADECLVEKSFHEGATLRVWELCDEHFARYKSEQKENDGK